MTLEPIFLSRSYQSRESLPDSPRRISALDLSLQSGEPALAAMGARGTSRAQDGIGRPALRRSSTKSSAIRASSGDSRESRLQTRQRGTLMKSAFMTS